MTYWHLFISCDNYTVIMKMLTIGQLSAEYMGILCTIVTNFLKT